MAKYSIAHVMLPRLSFPEVLAVLARAGADGIGIQQPRGPGRDPAGDLAAFRDSGLAASVCGLAMTHVLPSPRSPEPADPAARAELISRALESLAPYEPACAIVGPGTYAGHEPGPAWELAVPALQAVARRAGDLGVTVAIEPIHASIAGEFSFVTDMAAADRMCTEIGEPNVGIVFDIWHLWDTPGVEDCIRAAAGRIVGVQVDDRREPTRAWYDRALPGDGVAGAGRLLTVLREAGYDGWLDLEVITGDSRTGRSVPGSLWHRDPADVAADGLARMKSLWESHGTKG
jgi:sugar phosphate isomerase/epimerase